MVIDRNQWCKFWNRNLRNAWNIPNICSCVKFVQFLELRLLSQFHEVAGWRPHPAVETTGGVLFLPFWRAHFMIKWPFTPCEHTYFVLHSLNVWSKAIYLRYCAQNFGLRHFSTATFAYAKWIPSKMSIDLGLSFWTQTTTNGRFFRSFIIRWFLVTGMPNWS